MLKTVLEMERLLPRGIIQQPVLLRYLFEMYHGEDAILEENCLFGNACEDYVYTVLTLRYSEEDIRVTEHGSKEDHRKIDIIIKSEGIYIQVAATAKGALKKIRDLNSPSYAHILVLPAFDYQGELLDEEFILECVSQWKKDPENTKKTIKKVVQASRS